ncbi:hypothetical protein [Acidisoma cladoniae]|uniref:hypothetical protein n=1 Tax=Acidisoma cladoniae TaxID=3040935 RepID=UPI00254A8299|nr:hypothetical protein [Acidisoma sp. PAMC 29798]
MRRIAISGLLLLSGCTGFGHFVGDTHTFNTNPNKPAGDGANMARANGGSGTQLALIPETGNVWPTSIPAMPTLAEIQKQMDLSGGTAPQLGPIPTTPGMMPGLGTLPGMRTAPGAPLPGVGTMNVPLQGMTPPVRSPYTLAPELTMPKIGTVIQTPGGPTTVEGGTANYQTLGPIAGQGGGILIPNGNGTSTLVMPNGTISTIGAPR